MLRSARGSSDTRDYAFTPLPSTMAAEDSPPTIVVNPLAGKCESLHIDHGAAPAPGAQSAHGLRGSTPGTRRKRRGLQCLGALLALPLLAYTIQALLVFNHMGDPQKVTTVHLDTVEIVEACAGNRIAASMGVQIDWPFPYAVVLGQPRLVVVAMDSERENEMLALELEAPDGGSSLLLQNGTLRPSLAVRMLDVARLRSTIENLQKQSLQQGQDSHSLAFRLSVQVSMPALPGVTLSLGTTSSPIRLPLPARAKKPAHEPPCCSGEPENDPNRRFRFRADSLRVNATVAGVVIHAASPSLFDAEVRVRVGGGLIMPQDQAFLNDFNISAGIGRKYPLGRASVGLSPAGHVRLRYRLSPLDVAGIKTVLALPQVYDRQPDLLNTTMLPISVAGVSSTPCSLSRVASGLNMKTSTQVHAFAWLALLNNSNISTFADGLRRVLRGCLEDDSDGCSPSIGNGDGTGALGGGGGGGGASSARNVPSKYVPSSIRWRDTSSTDRSFNGVVLEVVYPWTDFYEWFVADDAATSIGGVHLISGALRFVETASGASLALEIDREEASNEVTLLFRLGMGPAGDTGRVPDFITDWMNGRPTSIAFHVGGGGGTRGGDDLLVSRLFSGFAVEMSFPAASPGQRRAAIAGLVPSSDGTFGAPIVSFPHIFMIMYTRGIGLPSLVTDALLPDIDLGPINLAAGTGEAELGSIVLTGHVSKSFLNTQLDYRSTFRLLESRSSAASAAAGRFWGRVAENSPAPFTMSVSHRSLRVAANVTVPAGIFTGSRDAFMFRAFTVTRNQVDNTTGGGCLAVLDISFSFHNAFPVSVVLGATSTHIRLRKASPSANPSGAYVFARAFDTSPSTTIQPHGYATLQMRVNLSSSLSGEELGSMWRGDTSYAGDNLGMCAMLRLSATSDLEVDALLNSSIKLHDHVTIPLTNVYVPHGHSEAPSSISSAGGGSTTAKVVLEPIPASQSFDIRELLDKSRWSLADQSYAGFDFPQVQNQVSVGVGGAGFVTVITLATIGLLLIIGAAANDPAAREACARRRCSSHKYLA